MTIDIFHAQTIDVPTLEAGMGVVRLRGCLYTPIHSYASHSFGSPPLFLNVPTHLHLPMLPCTSVCF